MLSNTQIQQIQNYFKSKTAISYVVLFGSALKGLKKDSDIDLLVGGKVTLQDRIRYAIDLEKKLGITIDIVPEKSTFHDIALQAFAYGKVILVHNKQKLLSDYTKARRLFDDNLPLRQIRANRIKRTLLHGKN